MKYSIELLKRSLIEIFPKYKISKEEIIVQCPFCIKLTGSPGTKKHLYINIYINKYYCFRCSARGKATSFVPGILYEFSVDPPSTSKQYFEVESLPENIIPIEDLEQDHPAIIYLKNRLENLDILNDKEVYFCDKYVRNNFNFGQRIIFPVFYYNSYKGFQARSIEENEKIRYVSSILFDKTSSLYNWENACKYDSLVIVEGIFDCFHIGDNSVAIFGKYLSTEQYEMIVKKNFEKIYVFLDYDAFFAAKKLAKFLAKHCLCVYYVNYKAKDPGILSKKEVNILLKTDTQYPNFGSIRVF